MGMPSRKLLLLGLAGAAGIFAIADNTLLSSASASMADLGGLVTEVKKAQTIAASLDSGDPVALQGLLDALADDQGVTPGEASPDLFGLLAGTFVDVAADAAEDVESPDAPTEAERPQARSARRVTMIVNSASGGLAMIDGTPLRAGETREGVTLVAVQEDGVVVRENGTETTLSLR